MDDRIGEICDEIAGRIFGCGAVALAAAPIHPVDSEDIKGLQGWLENGYNAGMAYMGNHLDLRSDPTGLLEGAKSIICIAFNYRQPRKRDKSLPCVAEYAYGKDYHDVLRKRLEGAVNDLREDFGGEYRICIDSAPLLERYWAEQSGLGKRGANGLIAVAGYGSQVFLAEILTTLELPRFRRILGKGEEESGETGESGAGSGRNSKIDYCINCGKCLRACPASALQHNGTVDARRCLSYLTIEHRGDWDDAGNGMGLAAMHTPAGRCTLFGCDICQRVCPLNLGEKMPATEIGEFLPDENMLTLDAGDVMKMTQEVFSRIFKGSAIKRAKLAGLRRNAENIVGGIEKNY